MNKLETIEIIEKYSVIINLSLDENNIQVDVLTLP